MGETIAQRLDREFPAHCDVCGTCMLRSSGRGWAVCRKCGHDNLGPEAKLVGCHRHAQFRRTVGSRNRTPISLPEKP